ncbi:BRO-N domain-containing protein [Cronobacter sakazakii]|uniref:BRO-N domain-containing protein n=1 Tax=Cronobacter sakazakii TaxID=28141 RepID=UPI0009491E23|nr:Bro-N domain-containing protein [Cronobacter sakazakii]EME2024584.1 Bro-N domain-containing protein [Cronobacter sakazakii]EME2063185.1 Bro-N domain-containing protein [Cronobacter sakazakii]EME2110732.1 Bro-N domain-containing protein [Cronobacter sakazakii]PUX30228.1 BRO-like protein [Cronobacter sakazakii]PUX55807.1 BRO-like protein [Cronobacter sakazakii]
MKNQHETAVYRFDTNTKVNVIMINGEPWFLAMDVCKAIGIANHRDAVRKLDDDEKGVGSTDTLGGEQEAIIISESGLYTLILRCRDAVTPGTIPYRFRKWVTAEVLPQIRRTGRYVREEISPADKAQKVVASFMPAILEAMKSETAKTYNYPARASYYEHIHNADGVRGLTQQSNLNSLLQELTRDGHDVSAALVEWTSMCNYVTSVKRCMDEISTHAAFIMSQAEQH